MHSSEHEATNSRTQTAYGRHLRQRGPDACEANRITRGAGQCVAARRFQATSLAARPRPLLPALADVPPIWCAITAPRSTLRVTRSADVDRTFLLPAPRPARSRPRSSGSTPTGRERRPTDRSSATVPFTSVRSRSASGLSARFASRQRSRRWRGGLVAHVDSRAPGAPPASATYPHRYQDGVPRDGFAPAAAYSARHVLRRSIRSFRSGLNVGDLGGGPACQEVEGVS
jgi:hypothetical protein